MCCENTTAQSLFLADGAFNSHPLLSRRKQLSSILYTTAAVHFGIFPFFSNIPSYNCCLVLYRVLTKCFSHEKPHTIHCLIGGLDSSLSPFQHIIRDKDETANVSLGLFSISLRQRKHLVDSAGLHELAQCICAFSW